MLLADLLDGLHYQCRGGGSVDVDIREVTSDSRRVMAGDLFICISGLHSDGHDFLDVVIKSKVRAVVVAEDIFAEKFSADNTLLSNNSLTIIEVKCTRYAMAIIAANRYRHPAKELKTVAITGTKGKTTTAYMIKSVLEQGGYRVGLIGTIEVIVGEHRYPAFNTTPESLLLHRYLREMADEGMDIVVIETSSQGFKLHRTAGIIFDIGIFTNLSPDHIGYGEHTDFDEYRECKSMLFRQCRIGLVNHDDEYCEQIIAASTCEIIRYRVMDDKDTQMSPSANLFAAHLCASALSLYRENDSIGIKFVVSGCVELAVNIAIPGRFGVYNALAAILTGHYLGVSAADITHALQTIRVKGRAEMIAVTDRFIVLIDYAHNALSLESLLLSLREYQPQRLVCLFGCGGNRDRERRLQMGRISGELADFSIITSDNPRNEEPQAIIDDIRSGIEATAGEFVEIIDRSEAIAYALGNGRSGDIIVLAGKGHEDYQEIKGQRYPMDERDIIKQLCRQNSY
ncbi:MAG: UDP-N-acetylmuramoyl-L-alanyl-D-glutamate--2,6-diaminopimelate ligase [Lachnospiraceae bacterium]|jgi:UDP-N-acetylmuramoyl-L-alanyl-D-glutamate--2,6-diaminopimelate ligase|nr:UDP-N-acetylmuramoyl-L-alanyl-D-glutamate--2,6-diaminopimelate ligase [Lachnospiraceae bacterium]